MITHPPATSLDVPPVTCPLCHTVDRTVTSDSLQGGAMWVCKRCGQDWDAARLEDAAAYAQFAAARLAAMRVPAL